MKDYSKDEELLVGVLSEDGETVYTIGDEHKKVHGDICSICGSVNVIAIKSRSSCVCLNCGAYHLFDDSERVHGETCSVCGSDDSLFKSGTCKICLNCGNAVECE